MATHIFNKHIEKVLLNSNRYRTIDLLIVLSNLSRQVRVGKNRNDYKFIIDSHNTAHALWVNINLKFPNFINPTTCKDCLQELISLGIVEYNHDLNGFELIDMKDMLSKKGSGYIDIRDFFFEKTFTNMNFSEKKALVFCIHLMDKKNSAKKFKEKHGTDIFFNLNDYKKSFDKEKLNIMNILRTSDVYYAKSVLDNMISTYPELLINETKERRKSKYGKIKGKALGLCTGMIYFFNIKECVKDNTYSIDEEYDNLVKMYPDVHENIEKLLSQSNTSFDKNTKINLLKRLYKYHNYVHEQVITILIKRLTDQTNKVFGRVRNIAAYIQHIVNKYPIYKNAIKDEYKLLPF